MSEDGDGVDWMVVGQFDAAPCARSSMTKWRAWAPEGPTGRDADTPASCDSACISDATRARGGAGARTGHSLLACPPTVPDAARAAASSERADVDDSSPQTDSVTPGTITSSSMETHPPSLWRPLSALPHLRHYLLPTATCDAEHASILACARQLVARGSTGWETVKAIREFVRNSVDYMFHPLNDKASDTLRKREGMCTNKANLQVALMRATGIPAGYILTHISRCVFRGPPILDEFYEAIAEPTVHCFAAGWVPESGKWVMLDGTSRTDDARLVDLKDLPDGGSIIDPTVLRGPLGGVQSCLDHQLTLASRKPRTSELVGRQNEALREYWASSRRDRPRDAAD